MPKVTIPETDILYHLVCFDENGNERADDEDGKLSEVVVSTLTEKPVTDVFLISHGWKGDIPAAIDQYNRWIKAMADCEIDIDRVRTACPEFNPLLVGLHWPSLPWGNEQLAGQPETTDSVEFSHGTTDEHTADYYPCLTPTDLANEALEIILGYERTHGDSKEKPPREILFACKVLYQESGLIGGGLDSAPGSDHHPFDPLTFYELLEAQVPASDIPAFDDQIPSYGTDKNFASRAPGWIVSLLQQLSFWKMKDRARSFGQSGGFHFLNQLLTTAPDARFHVMGHSFGCIVASSVLSGPNGAGHLVRPVDTLFLVQGALSHWSFAEDIPHSNRPGYFHPVVREQKIKGPLVTTRSKYDSAVGVLYPMASKVKGDVCFAPAGQQPDLPEIGALGAWGANGIDTVAVNSPMLPATRLYRFEPGRIYNLEASQYISKIENQTSGAHNMIAEPEVAHAFWEAVLSVIPGKTSRPPSAPTTPVNPEPQAESAASNESQPTEPEPDAASTVESPAIISSKPLSAEDMQSRFANNEIIPSFAVYAETGYPQYEEISTIVGLAVGEPENSTENIALIGKHGDGMPHLGLIGGLTPNDLADAGWGVIFPPNLDPAIKAALKPLLEIREAQAGHYYKELEYKIGQSCMEWLTEHGVGMFPVDPSMGVPFYLLIVGSPEQIPFEFQYLLDIYWAVGRLHFDNVEDYSKYADAVVAHEKGETQPRAKSLALFAPHNLDDVATKLFSEQVASRFVQGDKRGPLGKRFGYDLKSFIGPHQATKDTLGNILTGNIEGGPPSILFTGSHGMAFSMRDAARQFSDQGAIVCQDWEGYGSISPKHYFAASDVPDDASLQGMVHFFFACYGAGTPQHDDFSNFRAATDRQIAPKPFISRLPQKMLAKGALAVLAHVDRAWGYSFLQANVNTAQVQGFKGVLQGLMTGDRIGNATDQFDVRKAAISTILVDNVRVKNRNPAAIPDWELANLWVARNDARDYIILGDPAVQLKF